MGGCTPAPPIFSYTYTGYQPIKYCLDDVFYDSGANNDNSIPLIRFAEVLLNYAEAKYFCGDEVTASQYVTLYVKEPVTWLKILQTCCRM